jgi:hypothetical protein
MRYMLLVYGNEDTAEDQVPPEALNASYAAIGAYYGEQAQRGFVPEVAERLRPTATATTVRVTHGQVIVTDGPFAETKERLGGINIFECRDLDEAIELAAKFPTVASGQGSMEIRPIWEASAEMLKHFEQPDGEGG